MRTDKNQQLQANTEGNYRFGTDFSGDSYLNFLLGFADSYQQLQNQTTDHWIDNTYSFYGWTTGMCAAVHFEPRCSLRLGCRTSMRRTMSSRISCHRTMIPQRLRHRILQRGSLNPAGPGVQPAAGAAVPFYLNGNRIAGQNGFPRGTVQNFWGTVQPRVGFAYDLFGTGKTVLRAGAGLFFERIQGNDIYDAETNPPFAYEPQANSVYFSNPSVNGSPAEPPPRLLSRRASPTCLLLSRSGHVSVQLRDSTSICALRHL